MSEERRGKWEALARNSCQDLLSYGTEQRRGATHSSGWSTGKTTRVEVREVGVGGEKTTGFHSEIYEHSIKILKISIVC